MPSLSSSVYLLAPVPNPLARFIQRGPDDVVANVA